MKTDPSPVQKYLDGLPADRREALQAVRRVILANLPAGYEETTYCGMIGYVVPHSVYPAGYHCDPTKPLGYAALGSQKNYMVLHLMAVYGDPDTARWFRDAWQAAGKKLDMGAACVRFKRLEDVPLDVVGQVIARVPALRYVAAVERMLSARVPGAQKTAPAASKPARRAGRTPAP